MERRTARERALEIVAATGGKGAAAAGYESHNLVTRDMLDESSSAVTALAQELTDSARDKAIRDSRLYMQKAIAFCCAFALAAAYCARFVP